MNLFWIVAKLHSTPNVTTIHMYMYPLLGRSALYFRLIWVHIFSRDSRGIGIHK